MPTVSRVAMLLGQVRLPTYEAEEQAQETCGTGVRPDAPLLLCATA